MATSKTLLDFLNNSLNAKESKSVKGGKSYIPTDTGSVGYINWDDVEIRDEGFAMSPFQKLSLGPVGKHK